MSTNAPQECRAPDCQREVKQGVRSRNPRVWCSEACRVRTWRYLNPEFRAKQAVRSAEKHRARMESTPRAGCQHCGRPRTLATPGYCNDHECQVMSRRASARRRYESDPAKAVLRAATIRANWTPEEYVRDLERMRAYHKRMGWTSSRKAAASLRQARKLNSSTEKFTYLQVFNRDGWRCGICGEDVDKTLKHPDPMSVSLDHVVPLSLGGPHTLANTRCTHLRCNVRRSVGRSENIQLALL